MSSQKKRQSDTKTKETSVSDLEKYKVIMFNDDYTPMEFVIQILEQIFNRSSAEATRIMLTVHRQGSGIAEYTPKKLRPQSVTRAFNRSRAGFSVMSN